jgi:hypothetical protein
MAEGDIVRVSTGAPAREIIGGKILTLQVNATSYVISAAAGGGIVITANTSMNAKIAVRPCASNSLEVFQP